jgi:hypothetical protein
MANKGNGVDRVGCVESGICFSSLIFSSLRFLFLSTAVPTEFAFEALPSRLQWFHVGLVPAVIAVDPLRMDKSRDSIELNVECPGLLFVFLSPFQVSDVEVRFNKVRLSPVSISESSPIQSNPI